MARACIVCGARAYSDYCVRHKPRAPLKRTPLARPIRRIQRSPIKKERTKIAMAWEAARQAYFATNPSPWICHYCGKLLTRRTITLDHKIPRSRAPELRTVLSNLVPCCYNCNALKGSVAHDDYAHICRE